MDDMNKSYMAFAWSSYYPMGASKEFFGFFSSLEDALAAVQAGEAQDTQPDYVELLDMVDNTWSTHELKWEFYDDDGKWVMRLEE